MSLAPDAAPSHTPSNADVRLHNRRVVMACSELQRAKAEQEAAIYAARAERLLSQADAIERRGGCSTEARRLRWDARYPATRAAQRRSDAAMVTSHIASLIEAWREGDAAVAAGERVPLRLVNDVDASAACFLRVDDE